MPRAAQIRLPTDLVGQAPLTYRDDRTDGNLIAAIGPAANQIRRMLRAVGDSPLSSRPPDPKPPSFDDYVRAWEGPELSAARARLRQGVPMHAAECESGEDKAFGKVFSFLDGLAEAVLSGRIDETAVKNAFAPQMSAIWRTGHTFLAPMNAADEYWDTLPNIAVLSRRWSE